MIISKSVEDTIAAGRKIGASARAGDVFALVGDLGAGKTQLVKGIARGLGADAEVTSPTFTLIHEYAGGRLPLYHFDFYRLESKAEVLRLGIDEYLFADGVCVVEWADRFRELMPQSSRWISIRARESGERVIETTAVR